MSGRLYDKKFFMSRKRLDIISQISPLIVSSIIELFGPKSVIDVGCGDGSYLVEFENNGIKTKGFDNSREALRICFNKGLDAKKLNIVKDSIRIREKYDLAICFELAEHLPSNASNKLVALLCDCSDLIVFTAAPPGQGGYHHINEQPQSYWISEFQYFDYFYSKVKTDKLKSYWSNSNVIPYMINNLMVFENKMEEKYNI
jgi:2-polyprenyl-3-methyl-5-hydroxy-6-metoxy-1,4-benzoquinol methylase